MKRPRIPTVLLVAVLAGAGAIGCRVLGEAPHAHTDPASIYTSARPSFGAAVRDFFDIRPEPKQPFQFPHNIHIKNEVACDVCHEGVTQGPVAGLPSVKTCMICHVSIATDRPMIQHLAELETKHIDLAWQRVYGYPVTAHVRVNHAPHIRAGVECSTCHGNLGEQTVAERVVNLHMGVCVTCHREKNAPDDCTTCHF